MTAGNAAEDSVFMLKADQIVAIEVEKISGALIGGAVLLLKFKPNYVGIFIAEVRIVDRDRK